MSHPSRGALVAAGLAVSGLAAYQLYGWRRRQLCAERVAGHRKIALLASERGSVVCMSPATSTITFFQGPMDVAAAYLAKRVAEIVASNPWLASVLDTDPETGEPHTAHTTNPVPIFWVTNDAGGRSLRDGSLADLAPTVLELLEMKVPDEMTGRSLLSS